MRAGESMKTWKKAVMAAMGILAAGMLLFSCGGETKGTAIRVGTKDFTENLVVGELYALALEDAGYTVKRVFTIAGSVVHDSIVNGEIDLYPE